MLITIRNGKAELRNDNGGLVRTMGSSSVVSVSMSSELELVGIVYASGKAELRRLNGGLLRTLEPKDAVDISFSDDLVAIRMSNGKTRVRKASTGGLVRTI